MLKLVLQGLEFSFVIQCSEKRITVSYFMVLVKVKITYEDSKFSCKAIKVKLL